MNLRQEKTLTLTFTCKECSQNRVFSTCLYTSRDGAFSFEPVEIVTCKTQQFSSQWHCWNCTLDFHLIKKAPEWKHKQQSCHFWWTPKTRKSDFSEKFEDHQRNVFTLFRSFQFLEAHVYFGKREIFFEKKWCNIAIILPRP